MRLRYLADLRSLAALGILLSLFGLHWTGSFRSAWSYAATFPLVFIATIICHNHLHLGLFRGRRANRALSILLSFATGNPPSSILTPHNLRHHHHCNTDRDFVRCSLAPFRQNWLNLLVFPLLSILAMVREKESDLRTWKIDRPSLYRQALLERGALLTLLCAGLLFDPLATLVYLIAPWIFGQFCIIGINLVQHQDCDQDSPLNHSRNITGRLSNWLFFNSGYHTAHHLRPTLHWSRLPEFHRREIAPRIDPSLNHHTIVGALWGRLRQSY